MYLTITIDLAVLAGFEFLKKNPDCKRSFTKLYKGTKLQSWLIVKDSQDFVHKGKYPDHLLSKIPVILREYLHPLHGKKCCVFKYIDTQAIPTNSTLPSLNCRNVHSELFWDPALFHPDVTPNKHELSFWWDSTQINEDKWYI